ncbi:unnamed protein product [marine sediment metagenome]|uniref:Uncharacterized protein n=1 Tax=marine sediment metagenome TaxID=412755 RepID=X1C0B3_9ZZZZ
MNNNQNLSNELMKQDGITPVGVSDAERDNFEYHGREFSKLVRGVSD